MRKCPCNKDTCLTFSLFGFFCVADFFMQKRINAYKTSHNLTSNRLFFIKTVLHKYTLFSLSWQAFLNKLLQSIPDKRIRKCRVALNIINRFFQAEVPVFVCLDTGQSGQKVKVLTDSFVDLRFLFHSNSPLSVSFSAPHSLSAPLPPGYPGCSCLPFPHHVSYKKEIPFCHPCFLPFPFRSDSHYNY